VPSRARLAGGNGGGWVSGNGLDSSHSVGGDGGFAGNGANGSSLLRGAPLMARLARGNGGSWDSGGGFDTSHCGGGGCDGGGSGSRSSDSGASGNGGRSDRRIDGGPTPTTEDGCVALVFMGLLDILDDWCEILPCKYSMRIGMWG
jgi:hypothetical protein